MWPFPLSGSKQFCQPKREPYRAPLLRREGINIIWGEGVNIFHGNLDLTYSSDSTNYKIKHKFIFFLLIDLGERESKGDIYREKHQFVLSLMHSLVSSSFFLSSPEDIFFLFFFFMERKETETMMWKRNINWLSPIGSQDPGPYAPGRGWNLQHRHVPWLESNPQPFS